MPKFAVAVALFSIGFILAFLVFLLDNFATDSSHGMENDSEITLSGPTAAEEEQALAPAMSRLLSTQRLVEVLSFSIDEGTLESLQLIRSDSLRAIPSYRSVVLPELKRESLKALLERFSMSDWENWPYAAFSSDQGPSVARRFVDDVSTVNPELGRFLETSAQLMHQLHQSVQSGLSFDVEKVLKHLIDEAESLTSIRQKSAVPALEAYDLSVAEDPVFRVGLERKRCDLTVEYIELNPDSLAQHLELIRGLQPRYCSSELAVQVRQMLAKLSLDGSRGFRSKVLFDEVLTSVIEELSTAHSSLRPVIASFYLVGALDAIEARALNRAESFVDLSTRFAPNMSAQAALRNTIARARQQPYAEPNPDYLEYYSSNDVYRARMKNVQEAASAAVTEVQRSEKSSPSLLSGFAGIVPILVLLLVVAPMGLLVAYNRYVANQKSLNTFASEDMPEPIPLPQQINEQ